MRTGVDKNERLFNRENPAYFVGNADGRHRLWHRVLPILGKPLRLGGGASGGGKMSDESGLVVHHARRDFSTAIGLVAAVPNGHAAHMERRVAVGEMDTGVVRAGGRVLAARGVAANQNGAASASRMGSRRNATARWLSAVSILLGTARLPRLLRHHSHLFFNGNQTDLTRLTPLGLQFMQPE